MKYDTIIIGGGAAGLFCAITAAKRGRKVLILERNQQLGRKILISGGGRCNFTNLDVSAENFVSSNPHFCKSALAAFGPSDFIDLVRQYKIAYYEKTLGQLFCRNSSREILAMLLAECEKYGVEIITGCTVNTINKEKHFLVTTSQGEFKSEKLVMACGGLSFPKVGATGFGYEIARQFDIAVTELRPSLVALTSKAAKDLALPGVSLTTVVTAGKQSFKEDIVFTHRGISGPAILQISNYWNQRSAVSIDLMPDNSAAEVLSAGRQSKKLVSNLLSQFLPERFAKRFIESLFNDKPIDQISNKDLAELADALNNWQVDFNGTEGYDRAEVTLGGVSTKEVSSQTMESRNVDGLYFIGELLDVTGWLGGYNFQWAWSSGYVCGSDI